MSRWLLIEHRGGWERDALRGSGLDQRVVHELAARAARADTRIVLIRRSGQRGDTELRWAVADSRPAAEGIHWGTYATATDLLDVPVEAAVPPGGAPAYLVCTHARHDACCAIRGRPVAAALAAARPEQTWECSHVGGDRFAGNLVLLPHGLYYGHVEPAVAAGIVAEYDRGRLVPRHLRGRSALPAVVQVAQHHARETLHERGVDALPPVAVSELAPGEFSVVLAHSGGQVVARVRAGAAEERVLLTCHSTRPERPHTYRLLDLTISA